MDASAIKAYENVELALTAVIEAVERLRDAHEVFLMEVQYLEGKKHGTHG